MCRFLCYCVAFCAILHGISLRPLQGHDRSRRSIPSAELFSFMKRYGYIDTGPDDAEALYTEEGLSDVIKTVQRYAAIPETGVIDNATLALLSKPRCGVADVVKGRRNKRFIAAPTGGWKKRQITFFIANWSRNLGRDVVRKNVIVALDTWGKYGRLTFKEVSDPSADIIVAFGSGYHGDRYPFDGPGNILAHAFFPNEYETLGGDIHFDDDENWKDKLNPDEDGTHFFSVALHELGHSLGLSHSPLPQSVMYAYYKGIQDSTTTLDYDDILGMYELYIRNPIEGDNNAPHHPTERIDDSDYDESGDSNEWDVTPSTERPHSTTSTYNDDRSSGNEEGHTVSYHGDSETVDEHKGHDDKYKIPKSNTTTLPNICEGKFDAVGTLREELFFFKGQYLWRYRDKLKPISGYPIKIHQMFPDLPKSINKIDAIYERPDGMIVLFTGDRFWVYDGYSFVENSPQALTAYGLPHWLTKLDAAQNWAKNGKSYFYRGDQFWRYNEKNKTMDPGYPKNIERWRGVPRNLDAATTWKDGITYFFKDKLYWKFDNDWVIVTDSSPLPTPQTWLGCPKEEEDANYTKDY